MSEFIEDYCKENENDLAKRLQVLQDEGVLIGSDELELVINDYGITANVYIDHTITSGDVGEIQDILDNCWWCFRICFGKPGYYLSISLHEEML